MKKLTLAAASVLTLALAVPMVAQAGGHKGGGKHFEKLDTNADGIVSRVEAETAALAVFTSVDADADGFVTQDELKAGHEARRAEMKAKWAEKMEAKEPRKAKVDADPAKMEEYKAKKEARKAKMVEKSAERYAAADTDGDGKWSQAEFLTQHLEHISKVDTDGDGNITAAERDAAKAEKKERRGKWRDKPAEQ